MSKNKVKCVPVASRPHSRRLGGNEVILIIVITIIAAASAKAGMPVATVVELLGGAGVLTLRLVQQSSPVSQA